MRVARALPLLLSGAAVVALVTGCGPGADSASEAASSAASQAGDTARAQAIKSVCGTVEDGEVSGPERAVLATWGVAADQAGVPAEITAPLKEIVAAGDQPPAEAVQQLKDACAAEQAK